MCEARSFTGAADRLIISQPAVSRIVQQLERGLGRELIDRSGPEIRPTGFGEQFLVRAREVVANFDRALGREPDNAVVLRLGYTWSAMDTRILRAIRSWEELPSAVPVITRQSSDRLAGLECRLVDAGLIRQRPSEDGIRAVLLAREDRYAVVPSTHPAADAAAVGLSDLVGDPVVLNTAAGTTKPDLWPPDAAPETFISVDGFEDWLFSMAAGKGIGVTPASTIAARPHPAIRYVKIANAPQVELYLAWRTDGEVSAAAVQFADHVISVFAPLSG